MRLKDDTPPSETRHARRHERLWDDEAVHTLAMGCFDCADRPLCAGLHKAQASFSCLDDCCGGSPTCESVCPKNLLGFRASIREVDGFSLDTVPRGAPAPAGPHDVYAAEIYHPKSRAMPLAVDTVAVPLRALFNANGTPRYESAEALRLGFNVSSGTNLILIGSGRDKSIERWWGLSDGRRHAIASLRALNIALVTSPNYSLFVDQLRYDDLFNIKRIGITWHEFVSEGVPCALHINARTVRDYERFARFIRERDEVTEVAFEFGTGAGWRQRRPFHARHLAEISRYAGRPLRLVMTGGGGVLPYLATGFAQVTYIDSTPFMKAMYRQSLVRREDGELRSVSSATQPGQPLDALLAGNIAVSRARYFALMPERRVRTAPIQESPDRTASVPVVAA